MAEITSKTRRVAVTGATGLLGSRLVASLLRDSYCRVVVLLRKKSNSQKLYYALGMEGLEPKLDRLEVVHFNMSNPFEWARHLKGISTLYHCAAVVAIGGVEASEIIAANRELTARVVDGCLDAGVDLLVHVSSIATLGGARNRGRKVNENMRIDSFSESSAYTVSKFFAENQVLRGRALGLKTIIVHPAVILGSAPDFGSAGSASIVPQALSKGFFYTLGVMGYVDVLDVARAMIMLSNDSTAVGRNYVLCAENLSYKQLMGAIRSAANRPAPFLHVTRFWLSLASRAEKLLCLVSSHKQLLTSDIVRNMTSEYLYDGSKIVNDYDFAYTPIDQTFERITKEYLSRQ